MKKKFFKLTALVMTICLLLGSAMSVFAAGSVTYDGASQKFIFAPGSDKSPTDLFDGLKGAMPGDKITQKITVKNDASNDVKVNIYMRSLGAKEGSEEFLSKLNMTVAKSEDNKMAYMFDATAEKTDGLTDWVLLGTLYSGGEVNLEVTLDIPIELGNEFQDAVGYIDWQFKVEEMPVDPDDPRPPQTGDDMNIFFYVAVASISGICLILLARRKRRDQVDEQ